jgi:hypothetical protein
MNARQYYSAVAFVIAGAQFTLAALMITQPTYSPWLPIVSVLLGSLAVFMTVGFLWNTPSRTLGKLVGIAGCVALVMTLIVAVRLLVR